MLQGCEKPMRSLPDCLEQAREIEGRGGHLAFHNREASRVERALHVRLGMQIRPGRLCSTKASEALRLQVIGQKVYRQASTRLGMQHLRPQNMYISF